jgi:hypothetical protein
MGNVGSYGEGAEEAPGQDSWTEKPTSKTTVAQQGILLLTAEQRENLRKRNLYFGIVIFT